MGKRQVLKDGARIERVYNLHVDETHEYFANNILVHNCVMAFSICLQAREQQSMEFIPDRKKLEGFWTRDDLETAVDEGRIDRETADEYIKEKGYYCESYETRFKRERRKSYVH